MARHEFDAMTALSNPSPALAQDTPLLACEHCDTLYREPRLARHEVSTCARCGRVLARGGAPDARVTFALSITAAVLDIFANAYPVLDVEVQGLQGQATLAQAALAMAHGPFVPVAIFVALAMIVVPTLQILLLCWLSGHAWRDRGATRGMRPALRLLERLRPWSMTEVFLVGALIAIVKLSSFLEVRPGLGLFSLVGLMLLVTLLAARGTRGLWDMLPIDADVDAIGNADAGAVAGGAAP